MNFPPLYLANINSRLGCKSLGSLYLVLIDTVQFVVKALFGELISDFKVFIMAFHSFLILWKKCHVSPEPKMVDDAAGDSSFTSSHCVTGTNRWRLSQSLPQFCVVTLLLPCSWKRKRKHRERRNLLNIIHQVVSRDACHLLIWVWKRIKVRRLCRVSAVSFEQHVRNWSSWKIAVLWQQRFLFSWH